MSFNNKPATIQRLEALQPGESFCFYKGNFNADKSNSTPRLVRSEKSNPGAPNYLKLIRGIERTAETLASKQKIKVVMEPIIDPKQGYGGGYQTYAYIAIGR